MQQRIRRLRQWLRRLSAGRCGSADSPALTNEDGVTLVFKDGRAPVQIHDYVLTRNVVYVWDRINA